MRHKCASYCACVCSLKDGCVFKEEFKRSNGVFNFKEGGLEMSAKYFFCHLSTALSKNIGIGTEEGYTVAFAFCPSNILRKIRQTLNCLKFDQCFV